MCITIKCADCGNELDIDTISKLITDVEVKVSVCQNCIKSKEDAIRREYEGE